jgi:hypothetical protein
MLDIDKRVADIVPTMPTPGRWPAFNAIRHLNRAWRIRTTDLAMAAFRSITAEEEAATALIRTLQQLKYDRAHELKPRDHLHKNAVIPFFEAFNRTIAKVAPKQTSIQLTVDETGKKPKLELRMQLLHPVTRELMWAYPQPPLHVAITSGGVGKVERKEDFREGIEELARGANAKSVHDYLKERANMRNRILYAATSGYPEIGGDADQICSYYQRNVFTILKIYLLIAPHRSQQLLVQQGIEAFLNIIQRPPKGITFE